MTKEERKNIFDKIINYYGIDEQRRMFTEESSELNIALSKIHRLENKKNREDGELSEVMNNLLEELCDTKVILDQLIYFYFNNIDDDLFDKIYDSKLSRTLKRINNIP